MKSLKRHPYADKAPKGTLAQLARDLGITPVHMSRVINGSCRPSFELAYKLEKLTEGKVKAKDFGYTL